MTAPEPAPAPAGAVPLTEQIRAVESVDGGHPILTAAAHTLRWLDANAYWIRPAAAARRAAAASKAELAAAIAADPAVRAVQENFPGAEIVWDHDTTEDA